jgi:hypothetical protein
VSQFKSLKKCKYVTDIPLFPLETLLAYNVEDTITLENLMVTAYNMKLKETPFYDNLLIEESTPPANPFRADLATIDRIKSSSQYWGSGQWY